MDDGRLVYSVAEARSLLGISGASACELVARGELPVIRLGRRRLVLKAALSALIRLEPTDQAACVRGEPTGAAQAAIQGPTVE
jgi:excisionase family DNA binding protein